MTDLQGTAFEATPILADGRLVFSTPYNRVIALDPETGRELWQFDPRIDKTRRYANKMVSRGVAWWTSRDDRGPCASRILVTTLDARLIALDVVTGQPCRAFGSNGEVDLTLGIANLVDPWEYNLTSPPTIVGDRVVVGSSIADLIRRVQPEGAVRAFDVRTGRQVWRFDTVPRSGQPGAESWDNGSHRHHGGANVWSMMTSDASRGLVFLPVSTAGPDHFGGDRPGKNLFTDSVVALDVASGARRWHFQTVHHDLWDYDLAAPPMLVTVSVEGRRRDVVVQLTKTGMAFVLDRDSGEPVFPVEERPVPASDVPNEQAWPTQPFTTRPEPLMRHRLGEGDLWRKDSAHFDACRTLLRGLRNEGIFTPPSVTGALMYPSAAGGVNWYGGAFDEAGDTMVVPVNDVAMVYYLDPLPADNFDRTDGIVLQSAVRALNWLWRGTGTGLRYHMIRRKYFSVGGVFCNAPPWSRLIALSLASGQVLWKTPLGDGRKGDPGSLSFSPLLLTAGGVVFASGSADRQLRVFDVTNGRSLATFELPAGLHGGPMTYRAGGRQFVVVAPGGHATMPTKLGDWVIAYTLPD